jgi:thioredoxin-related protein
MMMKGMIFIFLFAGISHLLFAQDLTKFHLYKPEADAEKDISEAVQSAKAAGKNVLIQVGGNWCIWCARFNDFTTTDKQIDSLVQSDFIVYHLNYSKENKNLGILAKYGYPQRFGFPVFLILDGNGNRIHTQNSGYLEENKTYSRDKVIGFFMDWRPKAFDPKQYDEN